MARFDPFGGFRMDGQVAIATGGAQNIGEAIARTFAAAGARVTIADLNGESATKNALAIAAETGGRGAGHRLQRYRGVRHRALRGGNGRSLLC